jgi:hypothetical protein
MSHDPLVGAHLWFSGFLVVEEELVPNVMMVASELACMVTESKTRGLCVMVISGNLNGWKAAIEAGLGDTVGMFQIFTTIKNAFEIAGYGGTGRVGGGLIRGS